jgi:hypothetical protein
MLNLGDPMATKRTAENRPLKPMNPRSLDVKYTGGEPEWITQPGDDHRQSALITAFSWYNYHYGKKDAKQLILDWLEWRGESQLHREFAKVPEHIQMLTLGWLCRMQMRGLVLNERESLHVTATIAELVQAHASVKEVVKTATETVPRVTIQDRLRDIAVAAAADLEGMYDDMILAGAKMTADFKPMAVLRGHNVSPNLIRDVRDPWVQRRAELEAVSAGRDPDLVEGYGNFGKLQIRSLIKLVDQVIADCDSYVQVKKTERAPRKKKPVSPERLTQKFPYLREFPELRLKSEPVTRLVNATEAWLYDTKKRKLIHVVADSHVGCFTVKGTSIIGFDAANTTQKTLRKPEEQLKLVQSAAASARRAYKEIRSTEVKWTGRGNENLILLKIR